MGSAVNKARTTSTRVSNDEASKSPGNASEGGDDIHELNDKNHGTTLERTTSNTKDITSDQYARNISNTDEETTDTDTIRVRSDADNTNRATTSAAADVERNDEQRVVTTSSLFTQPTLRQSYVTTPYTKLVKRKNTPVNVSRNENKTLPRPDDRSPQAVQRNKRNSSINDSPIPNTSFKQKKQSRLKKNNTTSTNENVSVGSIKQNSDHNLKSDLKIYDQKDSKTVKDSKLSEYSRRADARRSAQLKPLPKKMQKQSSYNPRDRVASAKDFRSRESLTSPKSANVMSRNQMIKPATKFALSATTENVEDNNYIVSEPRPDETPPPDDASDFTKHACGIVTEHFEDENEVYASLSLRSSTLDSRLFTSDASDITYSDYSEVISTDTYSDYSEVISTDTISDPKTRLKYGLIELYRAHGFNVSTFPLLPPSELTYMIPWMTRRTHVENENDLKELTDVIGEDKDNYVINKRIQSFKQIFNEHGIRKIFLVGEHGTGKTLFFRYIITCWLEEHTKKEMVSPDTPMSELGIETVAPPSHYYTQLTDLLNHSVEQNHVDFKYYQPIRQRSNDNDTLSHTDIILEDSEELLKYKFLFYISLKHCKRQMDIREVIYKQYTDLIKHLELEDETNEDILGDILDNEQKQCLILIDDLDEWRPTNRQYKAHIKSNGLPSFDQHKLHTVVWTMTPSKLKQVDKLMESDLRVFIHGIDNRKSEHLVARVVKDLNANQQQKPVKVGNILNLISTTYLDKYKRFPYTLQSLVRILHQFHGNNMCNTFSQLLEMQFHLMKTWQEVIQRNKRKRNLPMDAWNLSKETNSVTLPNYYKKLEYCQLNKRILYILSKSAYSSWAQSVTWFGIGSLEASGVSPELVEICVQTGLLVRDDVFESMNLENENTVRITDRPVQMFLAATYISMLCLDEAYTNRGNIRDHSRKINAIVDLHTCDITRDIDKIFDNSDMIIFLCGLCPPLANRLIKDTNDTTNKIERIQQYRLTFLVDDREQLLRDIQKLTYICLHESLDTGEGIKEVYISDLYFDIDHMPYLKHVIPEVVLSIHIDFAGVENYDELSKFIFHGQQYSNLQKVVIRDESLKMTRADTDLVLRLLTYCAQSLYTFSCILNRTHPQTYLNLAENIHKQLLNMTLLQALELAEITLSHNNFSSLASVVSTKLRLRQLRLVGINCEADKCEGEEHVLYLTEHVDLEFLELDGREVAIGDLNAASLTSCAIANMSPRTEFRVFDGLRHSKTIQSFTQTVRNRPSFVCKTLLDSLPTWVGIQQLTLNGTNIAGNDFRVENLPNLHRVNLLKVQMTGESWISFVNSFLLLAQHTQVHNTDLVITPNEADITLDGLSRPIHPETRAKLLTDHTEKEKAVAYVKKRNKEFRVTLELLTIFNFETKHNV